MSSVFLIGIAQALIAAILSLFCSFAVKRVKQMPPSFLRSFLLWDGSLKKRSR